MIIERKYYVIVVVAFLMVICYPLLFIPLAEINLKAIYQRSFENVDENLVLRSIRTTLYIYYWFEKLFTMLFRPLVMSLTLWFGIKYLEIKNINKFKFFIIFFLCCEFILLLNDYTIIGYNLYQFHLNESITLNTSPLNLTHYFKIDSVERHLKYMLDSINIFSVFYFLSIFIFLKKQYHTNSLVTTVFIFNLIIIYLLISLIHPSSLLFGVT